MAVLVPEETALLRLLLATLAYRGGRCLRDAPESYVHFDTGNGKTTPLTILAHLGDLFDWTYSMMLGEGRWPTTTPTDWAGESARFHACLEKLDRHLASGAPVQGEVARYVHGPLADALTHVGQLAILRRMAGCQLPGESFFAADIQIGRVGADQAPPVKPFRK